MLVYKADYKPSGKVLTFSDTLRLLQIQTLIFDGNDIVFYKVINHQLPKFIM